MPILDQLKPACLELLDLTSPRLGLQIGGAVVACFAFVLARALYRYRQWPARSLPGPPLLSFITGSSPAPRPSDWSALYLHEAWMKTYGPTLRVWAPFSQRVILTIDPTALRHVLHDPTYEKISVTRHLLGEITGKGLLTVEGAEHKRQRRVMNPAFGPLQVSRFVKTFFDKSNEMRDLWLDLCSRETTRKDGYMRLDAFAWLNKVTLDIIGLAGFEYDIGALRAEDGAPNAVNEAVRIMFSFEVGLGMVLQYMFPALRNLPTKRFREVANAQATITRIGSQLIAEKKAAILQEMSSGAALKKENVHGTDLLSLLIRANLATDLPESARLSDTDILAQVPTFIVAGHETTSTAVAWALYAMACEQGVQQKLRDELLSVPTDSPDNTQLNQLTYLDAVVREALRVHAPVYETERVATKDDVVPLKTPYTGSDGVVHRELHVSKGDTINVPIQVLNCAAEYWGEDAHEFRPERWIELPDSVKEIPGAWANMLTFLAGQHACIGYRFSVVEMKALIFTIIRSFEIKLPIAPLDVMRRTVIVGRPALATNPAAGAQLPLLIRPVNL